MKKLLFIVFSVTLVNVHAQKLNKEDRAIIHNLQKHVQFLSDDRLEGRRTGTSGEKVAAEYIAEAFKNAGLQPKGNNGWMQEFTIYDGKKIDTATSLTIDENKLVAGSDFFPLAFSANQGIEASPSIALEEQGMPWFMDLKELLDASASNPHFDLYSAIAQKATEIKRRGGTALVMYNSSVKNDELKFDAKDRTASVPIPVVYINKAAAKKYFSDESASLDLKLNVSVKEVIRKGHNVIGFIDRKAPTTVVIGAHFDHLGYGEDKNSREPGVTSIHNGADDNASGTAAMIELAAMLSKGKLRNHNFLFIGFSGEELGLIGSKHFTENPTVDLGTINYMINLDMVGRLNDSSKILHVIGYGTSPAWGKYYGEKGKKRLFSEGLVLKFDSSGTGASDHTSFYRKDIPVLFYFTGLHTDYHKPSDDHDKINYNGQYAIIRHIYSLLEKTNNENQKLSFLKTRENQTTTSARFSVSLGIMPDYSYTGQGVKVDGVTESRPAQKAGMRAGDIVLAIGPHNTQSLENYMQALSKFKKGDKALVKYSRNQEVISTEVEF